MTCATQGIVRRRRRESSLSPRSAPWSPSRRGGVLDVLGRCSAQTQRHLGQPVVIEDRSGAGSARHGRGGKGHAECYTLLITAAGFVSSVALQPNLPYDPIKDFSGVAASAGTVIVVGGVASPSA